MSQNDRILVTGASGHLGSLTLNALLEAGQTNLIATTRDPAGLGELSNRGVEIRAADFKDPSGLAHAFRGAATLLLISTTDVGSRVEHHQNAVTAAKAAGVRHIIYTSWPNPETSLAAVSPDHAATEKFIKESGLKYTFLRNYTYAENLMYSLPAAIASGTLYGCAGAGKDAFVTRQDCANAAAGALIHAARYEDTCLDVSGPEAYTYSEVAAIVSEIKQQKVVYQDLSPEDFKAAIVKAGMPDLYAQLFVTIDLAVKNGEVEAVTDTVEQLSGKKPIGLRAFLEAALK